MINYPEIKSLKDKPNYLIVLLHGVGSDGHDLIDLVPIMQPKLPDCYFISPHGVEPYDMAPVGRQWFSLVNRDIMIMSGLAQKNSPMLIEMINEKQRELGLSNEQTILLGFSQGAMIGSYIVLDTDIPFLGFIGFSGSLIPPEKCKNNQTEFCLIHGEDDEIVPIDRLNIAEKYLQEQGVACVIHRLPRLRHTINHIGLNIAIDFIKNKINKK